MNLTWKEALGKNNFRNLFITGIVLSVILSTTISAYLHWLQQRNGLQLNDAVLNLVKPVDLSSLIFFVLFVSIGAGFLIVFRYPLLLLSVMYTYLLMMAMRITVLYLVPLQTPAGIINIDDPVLNQLFYHGQIINKDLFFSGHTATIIVFALNMPRKSMRNAFMLLAVVMGICLMWQHVHYTVDVVGAFVFTYVSKVGVQFIFNKAGLIKTN